MLIEKTYWDIKLKVKYIEDKYFSFNPPPSTRELFVAHPDLLGKYVVFILLAYY